MTVRFGEFEFDAERFELRCGGDPVAMEPQVHDVLAFLIANRDRVVSKEDLLDSVWGDRFVSESALTSRIKAVRQALGDDGVSQRFVQTIRGRGYRFVADVGDESAVNTADVEPVAELAGLPSGTVTFLFSDVEGSTRLWELHPADMRVALERHDALLRAAIERHGGYVFSTAGDSFAAAFGAVGEAAEAAVAAQSSLQAEQWPSTCRLRVRMGLHVGEAHERNRDYFGPAVNKTARVMAAGHGGQIVVSSALVAVHDSSDVIDLGEHRLKDLTAVERLYQLGAGTFPPLRTLDAIRHNLPVERTPLVGREDDIAKIGGMLGEYRLITLLGIGGTGKTRLATAIAADQAAEFADGVWFVDLVPATNASQVAEAIASAADLQISGLDSVATLAELIADRKMLVVLDNCEHITDDVADVVDLLLERTRAVSWMATSREPLQLPDERQVHVSPLAVQHDLTSPAAQLFAAAADRVGVLIGEQDLDRVVDICNHLDGLPLSIELAAAQLRHLSLDELSARLDQRFEILARGRGGRMRRQASLQAVLTDTWDMLDGREQELLRQLAAFPSAFTVSDVEAVARQMNVGVPTLTLAGLTDRSLIASDAEGHHRLLETVKLFARQRWAESEQPDAYLERHTSMVRDFLGSFQPEDWYTSFALVATAKAHYDDHRAVEDRFAKAGETGELATLLHGLSFTYSFETGTKASAVIDRIEGYLVHFDLSDHERGLLNLVASGAGLASRRQDWIQRGSAAALPLLRATGTPEEVAYALILGSWMTVFSDFELAANMLEEASVTADAQGATALEGLALGYSASAHAVDGRLDDSRNILTALGERLATSEFNYAHFYHGLISMAIYLVDDPEAARAIIDEMAQATAPFGEVGQFGWGFTTCRSIVIASCGDINAVRELLDEALEHTRRTSDDDGLPDLLLPLAALAWRLDETELAQRLLAAVRHSTKPTQTFMTTVAYRQLRREIGLSPENPLESSDIQAVFDEALAWIGSL